MFRWIGDIFAWVGDVIKKVIINLLTIAVVAGVVYFFVTRYVL